MQENIAASMPGSTSPKPIQQSDIKQYYNFLQAQKVSVWTRLPPVWSVMVFLPALVNLAGIQAPSTKFSVTRSILVMPCSKRPTPPTF